MKPDDVEVDWAQDARELDQLAEIAALSFAVSPREVKERRALLSPSAFRVARRGGEVCGGLTLFEMEQHFGGRAVTMGGVGGVAIAPSARGTGVAKALLTATLEELRARGIALSTLYPAAQGLYRALGYEQAGSYIRYRLALTYLSPRGRTLAVRAADLVDAPLLDELYAARALVTAGHLRRPAALWRRLLEPGDDPAHAYVVDGEGGPEGYVIYSLRRPADQLLYDVVVRDLVAHTPDALTRLLSLLADHRSLGRDLTWCGGVADPVLLAVSEQRHAIEAHWRWMTRLVDARAAMDARGFPSSTKGAVHLEITDAVLSNNQGRFVLDVHSGRGELKPGGNGDVRLGIGALAALYTGDATPYALRTAGLADVDDDDARVLAELFAGPAPWMPDFF